MFLFNYITYQCIFHMYRACIHSIFLVNLKINMNLLYYLDLKKKLVHLKLVYYDIVI